MRIQRRKALQFLIAIILISVVGIGAVNRVFAANFVGYNSSSFSSACPTISCSCANPSCTASQCTGGGNACEAVGEIVIAPFSGTLQSISFYTSPASCAPQSCGLPNQFVILTAPAGSLVHTSTPSGYCPTGGPGTTCGKEGAGDTFTIQDVEGLTGVSANTFTTVLLAGTVTVTTGQFVAVLIQNTNNEGLAIINTVGQCPCLTTTFATAIVFQSGACPIGGNNGAPTIGGNACSDVGPSAGPPILGATFTPSTSPITQFTQCYGNCGSPAVTLAKTNSTHTANFNSSITLFYQFQSQQNGFLLNVTSDVAKNYLNGQILTIGAYTTSCPLGSTPFSNVCPGLLQSSRSITNPNKGNSSLLLTLNSFPVANGQFVGISISGIYSPLDINDTNTNVQLFQTSGNTPAVINQASVFSNAIKMSLWAWIVGNVINGIPGTGSITLPTCAGFLDCLLPNWVGSLCANPTPSCIGSSSLIWVVVLTIFTSFFVFRGASQVFPGVKLPIGELFLFLALVWIFVEAGVGLLPTFALIFFFFVVSLMTAKHFGGKFL